MAANRRRDRLRLSRITLSYGGIGFVFALAAIILAGLSVQYVMDGLAVIGFVTP